MIDRDEIRIARRTAERNGYTVLPPREDDERDLNRFRQRQQEREDYRSSRPAPSRRFRDEVEDYDDEPVRKSTKPMARTTNYEDDEVEEPVRKPVARPTRPVYRDEDDEPKPRFRTLRTSADDDDDYIPKRKPASRPVYRDEDDDDYVPQRKPIRQEVDLDAARKAMEDAGYEVRKLSRLDMAKKVAQDAGFDVRKLSDVRAAQRPAPTAADDEGNDRPVRRVATRDGEPIRRPVLNRDVVRQNRDAIRTRTAPDAEVKPQTQPQGQPQEPVEPAKTEPTKTEPPKRPSFEDDYVNRAAAFFGDDD